MKLRPMQDRIIVKRVEEETKTAGGIYIPETAKEKPQEGEVVAVGNGKRTEDGKILHWMSRSATRYFLVNIPVPKSKLKARITSS